MKDHVTRSFKHIYLIVNITELQSCKNCGFTKRLRVNGMNPPIKELLNN